jgi:hypothetical protein
MANPHTCNHLFPGVPLATGSAALFGAPPPLSKLLLDRIDPFMLAGLLYRGAGAGLAIYHSLKGGSREAQLTRNDLP